MKTISTFIFTMAFVMLNCGLATAQTPKIKHQWQKEFDKNLQGKSIFDNYLGEDEDSYYLLLRKIRGSVIRIEYIIAKYDKKTLLPKELKTIDPTKALVNDVYHIAGEVYARIWENPPTKRSQVYDFYRKLQYGFYKFNKSKMRVFYF